MMEREQVGSNRGGQQMVEEGPSEARDTAASSRTDALDEEAEFERVMAIGRKVMNDHHAVLAALAK